MEEQQKEEQSRILHEQKEILSKLREVRTGRTRQTEGGIGEDRRKRFSLCMLTK
jgi:hypothetical protein